jgi:hypothetical protein
VSFYSEKSPEELLQLLSDVLGKITPKHQVRELIAAALLCMILQTVHAMQNSMACTHSEASCTKHPLQDKLLPSNP